MTTYQDIQNQIGDLANQVKANSETLAELNVSIRMLRASIPAQQAALSRERETSRERRERELKWLHDNAMRILYTTCFLKRFGRTPLIEHFVEEHNYQNLDDIDDATYIVLIRRHFNDLMAEAYASHRISMRLYIALVRYFDEYADRKPLAVTEEMAAEAERVRAEQAARAEDWQSRTTAAGEFHLPGHRELQGILNERVAGPAHSSEPFAKMGLRFPKGFILEGPRGCGKSYAVERLARHLGWDIVHLYLEAGVYSSSPQKSINAIQRSFREAAACAPCILAIDEMSALQTVRGAQNEPSAPSAEVQACLLKFLRTAEKKRILVLGMTDRAAGLAPAILHAAHLGRCMRVDMPSAADVEEVLAAELEKHPHAEFDLRPHAEALCGRPLSDVVRAVGEAAHAAAAHGGKRIEADDLARGIESLESRAAETCARVCGNAVFQTRG